MPQRLHHPHRLLSHRRMHRSLVALALAAAVSCTPSSSTAVPVETSPPAEGSAANPAKGARAELQSPVGVVGTLVFRETAEGLAVDGSITGLTPGAHGFHVHGTGECDDLQTQPSGDAGDRIACGVIVADAL